jgi:hypothetical protein
MLSAVIAGICVTQQALAQASSALEVERSNVTVYGGGLGVSDDFDDRAFGGAFYNQYFGTTGIHADVVGISREQDSVFAALGVSWQTDPRLRPRIMLGTSSNNENIHPEFYASVQFAIRPDPQGQTTFTPSITVRNYRSGAEELIPGVDAVYYFSIPGDDEGYYAAQGKIAVSFITADENAYALGAGVQTVRANGLSFGFFFEFGNLVHDDLIGTGERTDFYSFRPSAGFRLTPEHEIFVRGEFAHTDFYDTTGGLVGYKRTF